MIHGRLLLPLAALAACAQPAFAADGVAERALRCSIQKDASIYGRNAGPFAPDMKRTDVSSSAPSHFIPEVMVDGWQPKPAPLGVMLGDLGGEAGFLVKGAEGFGTVSWVRPKASLSVVLDDLTKQAGATWSFSSGVVTVSRPTLPSKVMGSFSQPSSRDMALALIDTLRGYGAESVSLEDGRISFVATPVVFDKIVASVRGVSEILAFDVEFMKGRPGSGRYDWTSLGASQAFPMAAGGRFVVPSDSFESVDSFFKSAGDVVDGGDQTVAGPAGWALVVPQSQCGEGSLEITLKPKQTPGAIGVGLEMRSIPMDFPSVPLGSMIVAVASQPVGGWIDIVVVRPRIVGTR